MANSGAKNNKRVKVDDARRCIFIVKPLPPKVMLIQLLDVGLTYRVVGELCGMSESALRHIVNPSWRRTKQDGRNYLSAFRMMQVLTQLHNTYVKRD